MNLEEEKELVEKTKKGPEAFGRIYDENYQKIFGYILKKSSQFRYCQRSNF